MKRQYSTFQKDISLIWKISNWKLFFKTAAEEPNKGGEVPEQAQQEEAQQDSGALDIQQPSEELPAQLLQVEFIFVNYLPSGFAPFGCVQEYCFEKKEKGGRGGGVRRNTGGQITDRKTPCYFRQ